MLSPNRTKFRKVHKGRIRGMAKGGSDITFGDLGWFWDPLWLPWDHFGHTSGTRVVFQNGLGRPRCPKRLHQRNKLTIFGTFLASKIIKRRS